MLANRDPQLKELLKLLRSVHNEDHITKVKMAIYGRVDELCARARKTIDTSSLPDHLRQAVEEQPLSGPCSCGTKHHAHSINCPQHPCNLQKPVAFK